MEHESILQEIDDAMDRAFHSLKVLGEYAISHYRNRVDSRKAAVTAEQAKAIEQAMVEYETARAVIMRCANNGWLIDASNEQVLVVKELADKWANTPIPGTDGYVDPLAKTVSLAVNNEAVKRGLIPDPAKKGEQKKAEVEAKNNPENAAKENPELVAKENDELKKTEEVVKPKEKVSLGANSDSPGVKTGASNKLTEVKIMSAKAKAARVASGSSKASFESFFSASSKSLVSGEQLASKNAALTSQANVTKNAGKGLVRARLR